MFHKKPEIKNISLKEDNLEGLAHKGRIDNFLKAVDVDSLRTEIYGMANTLSV